MYVTGESALTAPSTDTAAVVAELRDRTEITDALYRFGLARTSRTRSCSPRPSPPTPSSTSARPSPSGEPLCL